MDTNNTPGASAPAPAVSTPTPAAPSATPAAAAAPATPPTPSAPAAGAPETHIPVDTAAATADPRSTEQIAKDTLLERMGLNADGSKKEDAGAADAAAAEEPAAEEPAAATQAADAADDQNPFADFTTDVDSPVGPQALSAKIDANPALKAALEKDPDLKNAVFANARRAERADKYDEIVGSPDEAQVAMSGYNTFNTLSDHMGAIEDGKFETLTPFFNALLEQTALRDENGQAVKNADGSFKTTGAVGRMVKTIFSERLAILEAKARAEGNDELLASLDTVMESAGLRAASSADEDGLSEEMKQEKASIAAERKALDEQKQAGFARDLEASDARVDSKTDTVLDSSIKAILDRATGLDSFSRGKVEGDMRKNLFKIIRNSTSYKNQRNTIERMPLGPKREAEVVRLNTRFVNDHLRKVAITTLAEAGISIEGKNAARQERQAARQTAAQSDARTSMPPARTGTAPGANGESLDVIEARMVAANGGRPVPLEKVIAEQTMQRLRAKGLTTA